MRTQTELQLAQERAQSLAEDLSLIRTTLVPLLSTQGAVPSASGLPAQPANGALAALAQVKAQKEQQQWQQTASLVPPTDTAPSIIPGPAYACCSVYAASPTAAAAAGLQDRAALHQLGQQQSHSPLRSGTSSCLGSPGPSIACRTPTASPVAGAIKKTPRLTSQQLAQYSAAAAPDHSSKGGSLAGLVSELQADVGKLQQQLHHSRRQLKWKEGAACADCAGNNSPKPRQTGSDAQSRWV